MKIPPLPGRKIILGIVIINIIHQEILGLFHSLLFIQQAFRINGNAHDGQGSLGCLLQGGTCYLRSRLNRRQPSGYIDGIPDKRLHGAHPSVHLFLGDILSGL